MNAWPLIPIVCALLGCQSQKGPEPQVTDLRSLDGVAKTMVGAPCQGDADCGGLQCVTETQDSRYVGGYCTLGNCDRVDAPCPSGSDCRGTARRGDVTTMICLLRCGDVGLPACRDGYGCCSGGGPRLIPGWCSPTQSSLCRAL